jgi:hypothetical protein
MKTAGIVMFLLASFFTIVQTTKEVQVRYRFERDYKSQWELSDRASTIKAKREKLTIFLDNLSKSKDFADHDAVWLKTDANSFENNLTALRTLVARLDEIQNMPTDSFQYNTAIQQITAQEQGEARAMMEVFSGCYALENFPTTWGWISVIVWALIVIGGIGGIGIIIPWDNF